MSNDSFSAFCKRVDQQCYFSKIRIIDRWIGGVYEKAFKEFGFTAHQFNMLMAIASMEEVASAKLLSYYLKMEKSTVSRDLKILNQKGYILEISVPEDARKKQLKLTGIGRRKLLQCQKSWERAQVEAKHFLSCELLKLNY